MTATLYVCTTCKARRAGGRGRGLRPGAQLHAAIAAVPAPEGVRIVRVECLSACNSGCSVALSAPGRWSYVYGRLTPDDAADILQGAAAYAKPRTASCPGANARVIFRKQIACPHSRRWRPRMTDLTKIPVTVITGFLGAGKTTLIRHLMQNPQGKRLAILVNEFGTVGRRRRHPEILRR